MIIAVDLMGENGPKPIASGIKEAIRKGTIHPEQVVAIGTPAALKLMRGHIPEANQRVCQGTIPMGKKFSLADKKGNSSLHAGFAGMENQEFTAFVSPGETGFMVGLAITVLGRLKRGLKPALIVPLPNQNGTLLLLDAGASPDANSDDLVNFAKMGCIYSQKLLGTNNPRVCLLNMGEEPTKGNDTLQLAHQKLEADDSINFHGNIEGDGLLSAEINVVVCPGLLGNIVLKATEGTKNHIAQKLGPIWQIIRWLALSHDEADVGGAPLAGVNGLPIVTHGRAGKRDIASAIRAAIREAEADVNGAILRAIHSTPADLTQN
ncbi:MAG TPA: hypothetical protein VJB67_01090 [Patescibacteria group bacterium]|nr:hypothetical protein [Patescibacteria group bacterium]